MDRRIEAVVRILCDVRPQKAADAAYLFSQTADNESSVITVARKITADFVGCRILLLREHNNAGQGYPGFAAWKKQLLKLGISETLITPVELPETEAHNTLTEATALIRFARERRYRSIVITAVPFHQVRAFMTVVRAALAEFPDLKIYSLPGEALPWIEKARHSQGVLTARRSELISTEFERIEKYCRKGDLISFDALLAYLDQRDALSHEGTIQKIIQPA